MAVPVPSRSFAADSIVAARLGKDPRAGTEARKGDGVSPLREPKSALVDFRSAPFPYMGIIPDKDIPFLDVSDEDVVHAQLGEQCDVALHRIRILGSTIRLRGEAPDARGPGTT